MRRAFRVDRPQWLWQIYVVALAGGRDIAQQGLCALERSPLTATKPARHCAGAGICIAER
jgi:hypothetical protein